MPTIRKVLSLIRKADQDFDLLHNGDRVIIGLSGGKDSLGLLYALSLYRLYQNKNFTILPVHIDLGFRETPDYTLIKEFCDKLKLPLYIDDSRFVFDVLKREQGNKSHLPCSICSRMKKAIMAKKMHELKANKVAFAHHATDAVETLFMNMIHGSRVNTFSPKMDLKRSGVTFIRPLIYVKENDLVRLSEEEGFPNIPSFCPADKHTERENVKNFLKEMYKTFPEAEDNFLKMLTNYKQFSLFFDTLSYQNPFDQDYALKPLINKPLEDSFLIIHQGQEVGTISYKFLAAHKVVIYNVKGKKKDRIMAFKQLERHLSQIAVPVTIIAHGFKDEKPELGLTLTKPRTYSKKILKPIK